MAIPQTFDEAFARVKELVTIFKENESFYTSSGYNEADARKDFIDKFWTALGWDLMGTRPQSRHWKPPRSNLKTQDSRLKTQSLALITEVQPLVSD